MRNPFNNYPSHSPFKEKDTKRRVKERRRIKGEGITGIKT